MEMRAGEEIIRVGQDLTLPLSPLAFALFDSVILSHCSACFSPLSSSQNSLPPHNPYVLYCSRQCSDHDSNLHYSSAERHLHIGSGDTTDIRVALRLLRQFESNDLICAQAQPAERICGLMSNCYRLLNCLIEEENIELLARIKEGSKEMARARRVRDGLDITLDEANEYVMEEAILCLVLTNAVEVQVNDHPPVGMAVYAPSFSWINHSCCPNSCYFFKVGEFSRRGLSKPWIVPAISSIGSRCDVEKYIKITSGIKEYGPRIVVRNIKSISKDEEVTISYIDLLQPKAMRQSELWLKYRFVCSCPRCSACPPTYADYALNEIPVLECTSSSLTVVKPTNMNEAVQLLAKYVDDVIDNYMMLGNSMLFCQEMEQILVDGYDAQFVQNLGLKQKLGLNPLHYLSIKAYTTLASAYKVQSDDLLAQTDELQFGTLCAKRISAAYSLLLAGATHHLFLFESSLITSVATYWVNAGESLLNLAKHHTWDYLPKQGSDMLESSVYKFGVNSELLEEFERQHYLVENVNDNFHRKLFLNYTGSPISKLWTFLVRRTPFLESITSPIDFSWIRGINPSENINSESCLARAIDEDELTLYTKHERMNIYVVGSHCLSYGQFLISLIKEEHSH